MERRGANEGANEGAKNKQEERRGAKSKREGRRGNYSGGMMGTAIRLKSLAYLFNHHLNTQEAGRAPSNLGPGALAS